MKVREIKAKSILTKSQIPGADYVINPYIGCTFACSYCYAEFIRRFTGHKEDKWGEFLDVKINAQELLTEELKKLESRIKKGKEKKSITIFFSSVTDPYIGYEAKYKMTKKCLKVINESKFSGSVTILTKSPLVTRDIKLLKKLKADVGFTITTTDDEVSKIFEGNAPPVSSRIRALKKVREAGLETYVCINPLLPHFVSKKRSLEKLFKEIWDTGNKEVWIEHLNLSWNKLSNIKEVIQRKAPAYIKYFQKVKDRELKRKLNKIIFEVLDKYKFELNGGGIFDHINKTIYSKGKEDTEPMEGWKIEVV